MIQYEDTEIKNIYDVITQEIMILANNVNGLCVVKKAICSVKDSEIILSLQQVLIENSLLLIQNPFGNYALQTAFDTWNDELVNPIIEQFYGRFYYLSMHKYSSNVVEKCIQRGNDKIINKFTEEICQHSRIIGKIIF